MILSDLLGSRVRDAAGASLGRAVDVRFRLDGRSDPARPRIMGVIVSPRSAASYLGYERALASRPVIIDRLMRWRHRGAFLVLWDDIECIGDDGVRLREGYGRHDVALSE